jgi:parallel beta-helix repeat protein
MSIKSYIAYLSIIIIFFSFVESPSATTYYVATDGNDSNPGTFAKPFRTIQKGVNTVSAGDTLYVKAGTYYEQITISSSGMSSSPVTVSGYPGERPIIDGRYSLPSGSNGWCDPISGNCLTWKPLISIEGKYIIFQNFEVKQSRGRGIQVTGSQNTVRDCWVNNSRAEGIKSYGGHNLIDGNRVWLAANFAPYPRSASSLDWPGGISLQLANNTTIRGNEVFHVWGEGILVMNGKDIKIEDNVVYDNFAVNIYFSTVQRVLVQRNLVYNTNSEPFLRHGNPATGITFSSEALDTGVWSSEQVVINNIIAGHRQNLAWWGKGKSGALINAYIANNTFINAVSNSGDATNIMIEGSEKHSNVKILNNIFIQNTPGTLAKIPTDPAFTFSNNLWSKSPEPAAQGFGDIIANPQLLNANATLVAGNIDPNYYKLTNYSPAIDGAVKLDKVTQDFFGTSRDGSPDIGAHEYIEGSSLLPSTTINPARPHDTNNDGKIDIFEYFIWLVNHLQW